MNTKKTSLSINRKLIKDTQRKMPGSQNYSLSFQKREADKKKDIISISAYRRIPDSKASINESEERFRALFDGSLDGVFIHDFAGNFLDFNQAALDTVGYERHEMKSLNFASFLDKEQILKAMKTIDELLQTGVQQTSNEFKLKCKDGSYIYTENKSCLIYRNGKPHAIIGIARNITERKKSEERQKKILADLKKALDEIKTLKGIVPICSHCKKIRDDKGYWDQVESYVAKHTEAQFSHSICPECSRTYYPELADD